MKETKTSPIWKELTKAINESPDPLDRSTLLYLVRLRDTYQKDRLAAEAILRSTGRCEWMLQPIAKMHHDSEKQIEKLYAALCKRDPVCEWSTSIMGIGPVFALTLRAHIDISMCDFAGRIWKFAGITPDTKKPKRGEKRSYNQDLKNIVFLIAESFKKLSNNPRSFYGYAYKMRKAYEVSKNEAGDLANEAQRALSEKDFSRKTTIARKCYESGRLPPGHLDKRAMRWVGKLFLAHWHEIAYQHHFGKEPPLPYVIAIKGHKDHIRASDVLEFESGACEAVKMKVG